MAMYLELISGPQSGTRTPVADGLTIGRREGDVNIGDSKLSSRHAQVQERTLGEFWLVDLDSANGIKMPSGERVKELKLAHDLHFTLGRTQMRIIDLENLEAGSERAETVTRTFWDSLRDMIQRARTTNSNSAREIQPFFKPIRLKFIKGIQTGQEWIIGYGPRSVGMSSLDLHLEEPDAPAVCFRLVPEPSGVLFVNKTDREVRLNGRYVESINLSHGDVIEIFNTQIQVNFDVD